MASVIAVPESSSPRSETASTATRVLEATTRNIPKLKEQNYTQWKSAITHPIKAAKLWGYIDGSIKEPPEQNANELVKYMNEAGAVRSAILGSLEPGAQRHIEDALAPREAWLTLEKQYLTPGNDDQLIAIEQRLTDLRLEEGGDAVEHLVSFCSLRRRLNGTRFALDEQSSIELLYRSLPPSCRQSILTPERMEVKDFSALCAHLRNLDLDKALNTQKTVANTSSPAENYKWWGVPEDIKAFGLTGDKNPLLEGRAAITCRDCLLKDHEAGTPECPQYEWRKELWGSGFKGIPSGTNNSAEPSVNTSRISYEFSEPVKVVLDFDEFGLRKELKDKLRTFYARPSAIQQCAILPITNGRNVLAVAPRGNGKTATLVVSVLQMINNSLPFVQALFCVPTEQATSSIERSFKDVMKKLGVNYYLCKPLKPIWEADLIELSQGSYYRIAFGTPDQLLGLIRRNILKTHKLKVLALDDVDQFIQGGIEDQVLEIYQHIPPLAQVVASSTTLTLAMSTTIAKFLVDPIRIFVNRDEGMFTRAPHFFLKASDDQKFAIVQGIFSSLSVNKVFVLCHDITKFSGSGRIYYLNSSTNQGDQDNHIRNFRSYDRSTLVIHDAALPINGLVDIEAPMINYDLPNDFQAYSKRLRKWKETNSHQGSTSMVLTLVTNNTNELQVLHDFGRYYGIQIGELLWDGKTIS